MTKGKKEMEMVDVKDCGDVVALYADRLEAMYKKILSEYHHQNEIMMVKLKENILNLRHLAEMLKRRCRIS